MRVFLDANILFSAAATDGAVQRLLHDLAEDGHSSVADGYVWEEARRNLALHCSERIEALHDLSTRIELHSTYAGGRIDLGHVELPEKDLPVLASAVALRCDVLLTGDRSHFGHFFARSVSGITVHSPLSLAKVLWD